MVGNLVVQEEEEEKAETTLDSNIAQPLDSRLNTVGATLPTIQCCSLVEKTKSSSELTDHLPRFQKPALFNYHVHRKPEKGYKLSDFEDQWMASQHLKREKIKATPEDNFRIWIALRKWEWAGQRIERFKRKNPLPSPENCISSWIKVRKVMWKLQRKQKRIKLRWNHIISTC